MQHRFITVLLKSPKQKNLFELPIPVNQHNIKRFNIDKVIGREPVSDLYIAQ